MDASGPPDPIARESSPGRSSRSVTGIPQLSRSRKGSQEFSPTRNTTLTGSLSTVPSAAAVQRALSAQRPILQPPSVDSILEGGRSSERQNKPANTPSWPTSPRLKSPPPSKTAQRAPSTKKNELDQTQSNTSLKRLAPVSNPDQAAAMQVPDPQSSSHSSTRASARGPSTGTSTLETVAENSVPTTPSMGPVVTSPSDQKFEVSSLDPKVESRPESSTTKDGEGSAGEGSSKVATTKTDAGRRSQAPSSTRQASDLAKRSFTNLTASKPKPVDPPRTMTVETETVTSMPQLLGPDRSGRDRDGTGSVRTKPSTETIRPKKKKEKARKAPSIHAGTITSKADLFEAKVASAVDEAESDDSDETFVYESNPPDNGQGRHHSRTPSATSLASQEQFGNRNKNGLRSGSQAIAGKKSMKFSNSAYNSHLDGGSGPDGQGSQRNTSSTPRHHHISRHGRPHHASILDADSTFTQAGKPNSPRSSTNYLPRLSRPDSPRNSNGRLPSTPRKGENFDPYDAADDERAPLIGSVRINRNRHSRRPHSATFRHLDYNESSDRGYCGGWLSCICLGFVVLIVLVGISTFVMALNRPLLDVSIKDIQNVLASEQELMLDLEVEALNTNLFAITVNDLDVNIFAESPHVGSTFHWGTSGHQSQLRWVNRHLRSTHGAEEVAKAIDDHKSLGFDWPPWHSNDGVDEGTDPIDDPEPGTQKMLLGRVLDFDSPLFFDSSPIRRISHSSVGELRLGHPGNKTEVEGSARWERVLQHPFDLIIRGVIKYQLPLSSRTRSAKIGGRIKVLPTDDGTGDDPEGQPHNSTQ
ncbi:Vacuolar inheritance and morphology protein [Cladophialophora chaetospira]|uniref:Vacuolar inheritance and morphology protein n=1 Tax=Cladophialophora chaetospira TaxID=386627 RepID=A0AA39CPF6_9EURO|nr:Vacuolar inheritance and morphology protein [Cladophialophora chaetospira]